MYLLVVILCVAATVNCISDKRIVWVFDFCTASDQYVRRLLQFPLELERFSRKCLDQHVRITNHKLSFTYIELIGFFDQTTERVENKNRFFSGKLLSSSTQYFLAYDEDELYCLTYGWRYYEPNGSSDTTKVGRIVRRMRLEILSLYF